MDKLGKLDLVGVASLGAVAVGLLAAWMVSSAHLAASYDRQLAKEGVTLTRDGRMKVTVLAEAAEPAAGHRVLASSGGASTGPSIAAVSPIFLRP